MFNKKSVIKDLQDSKNIWIIIATIVVAGMVIGGSLYVWKNTNQKNIEQNSQEQISLLQDQIDQLQKQSKDLINQRQNYNDQLQEQLKEKEETPPTALQGYELVSNGCNKKECLFNTRGDNPLFPVGIATIKGYYTKYLDKAFGEEKYCDSLTITDGTKNLVDSLILLVDSGNTVHDKNEPGQPIVNFDINGLSEDDKQKFLASTKSNPVELIVLQPLHIGASVRVCFSMFDILEVN